MRRRSVLLVMGMVQAGLLAILVSAGTLNSTDNFTSFDTNRWS
ncbi:MAG TPA: hypothetical protein VNA27_09230 [Rubrobacteraceae bacterium]|nr:hypothetical protein [Rubrobacteraceae bacterium]